MWTKLWEPAVESPVIIILLKNRNLYTKIPIVSLQKWSMWSQWAWLRGRQMLTMHHVGNSLLMSECQNMVWRSERSKNRASGVKIYEQMWLQLWCCTLTRLDCSSVNLSGVGGTWRYMGNSRVGVGVMEVRSKSWSYKKRVGWVED